MNILLTGGTGRIGGYVAQSLARDHRVTLMTHGAIAIPGFRTVRAELLEPASLTEACDGQDAVIHLAAVPRPASSPRALHTRGQVMQTNVMGVENLLAACAERRVPRFVFASTDAAFGFIYRKRDFTGAGVPLAPAYFPVDEAQPCAPQDSYGLSKLLSERICRSYSDAFGMQTICLRICNVWFPPEAGDDGLSATPWALDADRFDWYRKALADPALEKWRFWAYTDIRDICAAFRLAVENATVLHDVLLIPGGDTDSTIPTEQLIGAYWPDVPVKGAIGGFATAVSYARAEKALGYRPRYSWRDWPAMEPDDRGGGIEIRSRRAPQDGGVNDADL